MSCKTSMAPAACLSQVTRALKELSRLAPKSISNGKVMATLSHVHCKTPGSYATLIDLVMNYVDL